MPQVFKIGSYWIYFWSNENEPLEPIHVHVSKGSPGAISNLKIKSHHFCFCGGYLYFLIKRRIQHDTKLNSRIIECRLVGPAKAE